MGTSRDFPRTISSLDAVFSFAREILPAGLDEKTVFSVEFALEEIFTNMVRHNEAEGDRISITAESDALEIRISLCDYEVEPVDPAAFPVPDVDAPLADRRPGGLGVFLTRALVDRVDYEFVDRTMRVTLIKSLESSDVPDRA